MHLHNHLLDALSSHAQSHPNHPFLIFENRAPLTYGAFFANAQKIAAALTAIGIRPNDRVAVQAPKTAAMLELYLGTVMAGGVFLPLNPAYTAAEISYFLNDATPRVFVCDPKDADSLAPVAKRIGTQMHTLGRGDSGNLMTLRDQQSGGFQPVPRGADDLAAILYTSGTTGRSKGAMLTHRALASNSAVLKDYWRFDSHDVLIHALPIFHTHGLFVATNIALMAGASCIFMEKFDAAAIVKAMPNATALMGVPTFYTRLLKQPNLTKASKNMRLFVSGSAPLLPETHAEWQRVTCHQILERYGMTETNMNTSNPYDGPRRAGTVGLPLPGVEVVIADAETGKKLGVDEIGVLEVRGDNVFAGYWNMPEKTAEELRENGFFITGDLAKIDADGYVHIVGRTKDLIISGGLNIYPIEVETAIDALPEVVETAVIGVPDPDFGESVLAVVVAAKNLTETEILAGLTDSLAKFKQPKAVRFVPALPRNAMGKVQKNALRKIYAAHFKI